jgi:hypothetical protein
MQQATYRDGFTSGGHSAKVTFRPVSRAHNTSSTEAPMKTRRPNRSWYSMKGTTVGPSVIPGYVNVYRCGKFIASVPAEKIA